MADGELNYLHIAQILGGTVQETSLHRFGRMGLAGLSVERLRLAQPTRKRLAFTVEEMGLIALAFEKVRKGYEVDRVLIDPELGPAFLAQARKFGIKAESSEINRCIQAIRKSKRYGIGLKPSSRDAGIQAGKYLHAAELGYAQMNYQKRVSVDLILTVPEVARDFVHKCREIAPHGSGIQFKWAALELRKMRAFGNKRAEKIAGLDLRVAESALTEGQSLAGELSGVPADDGVFAIIDHSKADRYLYVSATENLARSMSVFREGKPFAVVGGPFWKPKPSDLEVRYGVATKRRLGSAGIRDVSFKLIEERHPLFNMKIDAERKVA